MVIVFFEINEKNGTFDPIASTIENPLPGLGELIGFKDANFPINKKVYKVMMIESMTSSPETAKAFKKDAYIVVFLKKLKDFDLEEEDYEEKEEEETEGFFDVDFWNKKYFEVDSAIIDFFEGMGEKT